MDRLHKVYSKTICSMHIQSIFNLHWFNGICSVSKISTLSQYEIKKNDLSHVLQNTLQNYWDMPALGLPTKLSVHNMTAIMLNSAPAVLGGRLRNSLPLHWCINGVQGISWESIVGWHIVRSTNSKFCKPSRQIWGKVGIHHFSLVNYMPNMNQPYAIS